MRTADEVLALEILDQRMVGVVALRRARQHVACQFESRLEFTIGDGGLPLRWVRDNRVADFCDRIRLRMPDSNAGESLCGRERQIERRRVEVLPVAMTERRGRVGMIRRPVAREVQIAMDA